jgi:hypothetical protein
MQKQSGPHVRDLIGLLRPILMVQYALNMVLSMNAYAYDD